jgi:hypothetical protein
MIQNDPHGSVLISKKNQINLVLAGVLPGQWTPAVVTTAPWFAVSMSTNAAGAVFNVVECDILNQCLNCLRHDTFFFFLFHSLLLSGKRIKMNHLDTYVYNTKREYI